MPEFVTHYINMWKNYANFSGRTTVPEYWWAFLCNFLVSSALNIIGIDMLASLYTLAALVPGIALGVRRLNDMGKKWYHLFIGLIPIAGTIILIVWFCKPSVSDTTVEF